jgi:hypothetical protein
MWVNCSYTNKGAVMTETSVVTRELTANDRCDSCSAAASVIATFLHGELMFCGHHARKMSSELKVKALEIFDPTGEINLLN